MAIDVLIKTTKDNCSMLNSQYKAKMLKCISYDKVDETIIIAIIIAVIIIGWSIRPYRGCLGLIKESNKKFTIGCSMLPIWHTCGDD